MSVVPEELGRSIREDELKSRHTIKSFDRMGPKSMDLAAE